MDDKTRRERSFTIVELVVGLLVLFLVAAIGFSLIRLASQKTKIAVAKAYISQYASLVEDIKNQLNFFPPSVHETLESLTYSESPFPERRTWGGPYLKTIPIDPWKTPYFYCVTNGLVFGPQKCQRNLPGQPFEATYTFRTPPTGQATIVIHNFQAASCRIVLNGVEVIAPPDFNEEMVHFEIPAAVNSINNLYVWIPSRVRLVNYFLISVTSPFSRKTTYMLGSRGADKRPGGAGFDADLVWIEGQATSSFK